MLNIKNLREITGAGFLDCKKALQDSNNSIENAIDFLRKKGLAKATKKSTRVANEGAIGIYSNETLTSIIQINTETDFAAKNDIFLNFIDEIGNFSLEAKNFFSPSQLLNPYISLLHCFNSELSQQSSNCICGKGLLFRYSNLSIFL